MPRNLIRTLLLGASMTMPLVAQQVAAPDGNHLELAVTGNATLANVITSKSFWMGGGSAQLGLPLHRRFSLVGDFGGMYNGNVLKSGTELDLLTYTAGPRYTVPFGDKRFSLYGQFLGGGASALKGIFPESGQLKTSATSAALLGGGGLDLGLTPHIALRLVEANWLRTFLPNSTTGTQNNLRLGAGIVYSIGTIAPPPPVTLACSASPASVFPGEPVTVTATAGNLDPKLNAVYSWSGAGVAGAGATANVATAALEPGSYTVKGNVKQGKAGKEGLKPGQSADCSASFTVKAYEPPTISCSASPSTLKPGESSTVTSVAMSPQNRPLTISYTATAGTISGTGNTASYSSTGAPTGAVGITCTVADDKGHTATANTGVTIAAPPPPPQPHTASLCSITFDKDKKRPTRVDNEAKACLDEVALNLQRQSDAKAVVVGESDAKEKAATAKQEKRALKNKHVKVEYTDAERAVNTKQYLVTEKGIDASRVSVATGMVDGQKVENYLVPAGANFNSDVTGTTPVDESKVKAQVRKPLGERHHASKKAEKPAAAKKAAQ